MATLRTISLGPGDLKLTIAQTFMICISLSYSSLSLSISLSLFLAFWLSLSLSLSLLPAWSTYVVLARGSAACS